MGHMVGKDVYRQLGHKIDGLITRAPWNDTFHAILKELYTSEEADLVVRMPYGMASLDKIAQVTGYEKARLQTLLEGLCEKGLVLDVGAKDRYLYIVSPLIIGIFEFTMMRTRGELNTKEWARLFHEYLSDPDTFYKANCGSGQKVSALRTIPHEGTISDDAFVEVLDYEKATAITESAKKFVIGICSCRHEKLHMGEKKCDVPLETCSTFGASADVMIRHGFGKEVSREQMLENNARSREMGLVFCADNVKKNVSFICHCCGCCCNVLLGVSRFGYPNTVVTSNYIAQVDDDACSLCGTCADVCPVNAITMSNGNGTNKQPTASGGALERDSYGAPPFRVGSDSHEKPTINGGPLQMSPSAKAGGPDKPIVNEKLCLGCGVCALGCTTDSMRLVPRAQRVLTPEDTFERVILQALERGTLQNLLFDNPQSTTHGFMRAFVGGFLKLPPVKKSLMSDTLRSRFLTFMRRG
jgi:Fe-S-cluster-containing hydrogenase component 2